MHLLAIGMREGIFATLRTARDLNTMSPGQAILVSPKALETAVLLNAKGTEPLRATVLVHNMARSFRAAGFDKASTFYSLVSLATLRPAGS